ncbi:MAG TPA: hypothetical protein VJ673_22755 [Aromatoleum sp.]|uniref:hypothetical protein n=1 Tax=Aromatoleum sp. TaxID=2307007 RepID=UPI002B495D90|nr:hypothetical protein [Aromatoleum sp.]HJV28517.1 hypothetical protein [Aromatoleum sp.]
MKKTDLEKLNGLKIRGRMKNVDTPARFSRDSNANGAAAKLNPLMAKLLGKRNEDSGNDGSV